MGGEIQTPFVQALFSELSPKQINKHILNNINVLLLVVVFKSAYPNTSAVWNFFYMVVSVIKPFVYGSCCLPAIV